MKRLMILTLVLAITSPTFATFNILFTPVTGISSYTCLAFERHQQQNHPELGLSITGTLIPGGDLYTFTPWASVTCTVAPEFFPGSNGNLRYGQITDASLDPNLPALQVISCIKSVDSNGTESTCVNAEDFTPSNPSNILQGGSTSTPIANASDQ